MTIPGRLSETCLNQLEQALYDVGSSHHLGITLSSKIVDGRVATSLLIKSLSECNDVVFSTCSLDSESLHKSLLVGSVIVVSCFGDSFILSAIRRMGGFLLKEYFKINEEVFFFEASLSELIKEFDLVDQAFCIQSATEI